MSCIRFITETCQTFQQIIIYYFLKTSQISTNFGYVFNKKKNITLCVWRFIVSHIDFTRLHKKNDCIITHCLVKCFAVPKNSDILVSYEKSFYSLNIDLVSDIDCYRATSKVKTHWDLLLMKISRIKTEFFLLTLAWFFFHQEQSLCSV